MAKYLIDVNLPYYFGIWNGDLYTHQSDIDPRASDKNIWNYATENDMVIVTKDSDFSNRILLEGPPPRIIHIKLGNMKMNDFHQKINQIWDKVIELSETHKLVNVYTNKIEAIN